MEFFLIFLQLGWIALEIGQIIIKTVFSILIRQSDVPCITHVRRAEGIMVAFATEKW